MPDITYISADGERTTLALDNGTSLMEGAVSHGVDGIIGECGGSLMCATCHVYVEGADMERLPPMGEIEEEMLRSAASEVRSGSRLSCQIKVSPELDGLTVRLPSSQH